MWSEMRGPGMAALAPERLWGEGCTLTMPSLLRTQCLGRGASTRPNTEKNEK